MKKWFSLILAVLVILYGSFVSRAEGEILTQDSPDNSGNITVDYNAAVTYTVTIPASVTFSDTETEVERSLQVSNVVLREGSALHVGVSSLNGFQMKYKEGYIEYHLMVNYNDTPKETDYTILTVPAGESAGWAILKFVTNLQKDHVIYAGDYTDTLTFTVEVE